MGLLMLFEKNSTSIINIFSEIKEDILKTTSADKNISSQLLKIAITTETLMDVLLSLIRRIMEIMAKYKETA